MEKALKRASGGRKGKVKRYSRSQRKCYTYQRQTKPIEGGAYLAQFIN
jgi:hypothetical protein